MKYVSEYMEELVQKAKGIKTDEATSDEKLFIQQVEEAAKIVENEKLGDKTLILLMFSEEELKEVGQAKKEEDERKEQEENSKYLAEHDLPFDVPSLPTTVFVNDELIKARAIGNIISLIQKEYPDDYNHAREIVDNIDDETPSKETQEIGDEINHETPSKETQKKMGCLAVLATVLNPSNWFSKEDPVLTPEQEKQFEEEDKKWDQLLSSLRIEPKEDKNFIKRFKKEFYERLAAEKRKEKR